MKFDFIVPNALQQHYEKQNGSSQNFFGLSSSYHYLDRVLVVVGEEDMRSR